MVVTHILECGHRVDMAVRLRSANDRPCSWCRQGFGSGTAVAHTVAQKAPKSPHHTPGNTGKLAR